LIPVHDPRVSVRVCVCGSFRKSVPARWTHTRLHRSLGYWGW
jgi:hypothetical protein